MLVTIPLQDTTDLISFSSQTLSGSILFDCINFLSHLYEIVSCSYISTCCFGSKVTLVKLLKEIIPAETKLTKTNIANKFMLEIKTTYFSKWLQLLVFNF